MRIPTATYRVQLNADFNFSRLSEVLEYLSDLGISDIYASPIFKARQGSTHGYDVLDANRLNPELGTAADWGRLTEKRRKLQIGWLQDIVPNHRVYSGDNIQIQDLLEKGPHGIMGDYFDIIWDHPHPSLKGRVCAPFLGAPLEECLEKGELKLQYDARGLYIGYYEHRFALALKSYPFVFGEQTDGFRNDDCADKETHRWYELIHQLAHWDDKKKVDTDALKAELYDLFKRSDHLNRLVERRLNFYNHQSGSKHDNALAELIRHQFFQPDFWQNAAHAINYRRFFSINDLIALRQENAFVFEHSHALTLEMIRNGIFDGLRVDHVDGLLAPGFYLDELRSACGQCYLVVEKILTADEKMPGRWPIQGTTGYEFAAHLDRLFTFAQNQERMDAVYEEFCQERTAMHEVVRQSKMDILHTHFSGDLDNLAYKLKSIKFFSAESIDDLTTALAHMVINIAVYRTYRSDEGRPETDRRLIKNAVAAAIDLRPGLSDLLVRLESFFCRPLKSHPSLGQMQQRYGDPDCQEKGAFEQLCTVLAAKGVEDTALYRFHRLTAHNEVGGDPEWFAESSNEFHHFISERMKRYPHSLNALSTHDSKRCADVRARLLSLAEIPDEWRSRIHTWQQMHQARKASCKSAFGADAQTTYLLYQTLAATCPAGRQNRTVYNDRIKNYMIKACREAKRFTDWTRPDQTYEAELTGFIDHILSDAPDNAFLGDLEDFAARLAYFGRFIALAQTLIQLTAPGVPDMYQGSEFFVDSLVDPDNRRPVDYELRRRRLQQIRTMLQTDPAHTARQILDRDDADRLKLYLTYIALQARQQNPMLFAHGEYLPIEIDGPQERHVVSFARVYRGKWYVTVVPRFFRVLTENTVGAEDDIWRNTHLILPEQAPIQWHHLMTRSTIERQGLLINLKELFTGFPVALVTSEA